MQLRSLGGKDPLFVGTDNPLQYSCLENPMDRGAWWTAVHGLQRVRQDWATEHTQHFLIIASQKRWLRGSWGNTPKRRDWLEAYVPFEKLYTHLRKIERTGNSVFFFFFWWYGGGFRIGNTCIPVVDSCWCMAKPMQYCKVINLQLK